MARTTPYRWGDQHRSNSLHFKLLSKLTEATVVGGAGLHYICSLSHPPEKVAATRVMQVFNTEAHQQHELQGQNLTAAFKCCLGCTEALCRLTGAPGIDL